MCSGKKSQETKFVWPVKPPVHMWSVTKSSVPVRKQVLSNKSKVMLHEDDRNCQTSVMWPVKPEIEMWLPKPAVPYEYRRLCKDQSCQSTRCYKKHSDPKRQKMQYKVRFNQLVNQKDAILDATHEKLSPRSHRSPVNTKVQVQRRKRNINMCVKRDIKTQVESLSTVHINYSSKIWIKRILQCMCKTIPYRDGIEITTCKYKYQCSCIYEK